MDVLVRLVAPGSGLIGMSLGITAGAQQPQIFRIVRATLAPGFDVIDPVSGAATEPSAEHAGHPFQATAQTTVALFDLIS